MPFCKKQSSSYGNDGNAFDLTDLLECAQITEEDMQYSALSFYDQYVYVQQRNRRYENQNWNNYYADNEGGNENAEEDVYFYVGPACGGDGMSIKLAVYGDEYCTKRVEGITVRDLLGYNPLSDNMDIFP